VNGNPISYRDPLGLFGWADMPTLPQGVVNFASGYGSYYGGLLNGAGHLLDRSGFAGPDAQQSAIQAEAVLALGINTIATNPAIAKQAACTAENWAANNKAYLAGRLTAGALLSVITGLGPYGGVALGLFAGMGDALNNIQNGMNTIQQIIPSMMGMPY